MKLILIFERVLELSAWELGMLIDRLLCLQFDSGQISTERQNQ